MSGLPKTKKTKYSSSTISEKTDSDFGENEGFFDPPPFVAYSRGILVPSSNVQKADSDLREVESLLDPDTGMFTSINIAEKERLTLRMGFPKLFHPILTRN